MVSSCVLSPMVRVDAISHQFRLPCIPNIYAARPSTVSRDLLLRTLWGPLAVWTLVFSTLPSMGLMWTRTSNIATKALPSYRCHRTQGTRIRSGHA